MLAAKGNAQAFGCLCERHYMMVYKVAYKWCRVKEDAEDIAQEVFVKLADTIWSFRRDAAFQTWLYRVTVNAAKDYYKKQRNERKREAAYAEQRALDGAPGDQEDGAFAGELHAAVHDLPEKLRDAVLLVCGEGMSHKEAAAVLNCAETAVSLRIFRARQKLIRYLEPGANG